MSTTTANLVKQLQRQLLDLRAVLSRNMIYTPLEQHLWDTKVSQAFGIKNSHYRSGIHNGVDHAVPVGTPLRAVCDGFEIYQVFKNHTSLGNACYSRFTVNGKRKWMRFLHLQSVPVVGVYKAGAVFGKTGNTGDSTGPHCHTELWKVAIDTRILYSKTGVLANLIDPVAWFNNPTK